MIVSYSGPSADTAVFHDADEAYKAALASGHKDTYAPEAWEPATDPEADEKTALQAKLDAAGIAFDKRYGVAKLRELVASIPEE